MSTIYCRHIRPSGRRCQSPALHGQPLCFHHASAKAHLRVLHPPEDGTRNMLHIRDSELEAIHREPMIADCYVSSRAPVVLEFPPLEDANAIQLALSMVLTVLGQDRLDPRRAASMLYNLQIAAGNARNLSHDESHAVRVIVQDPSGNVLSSDEDPEEVVSFQRSVDHINRPLEEDEDDEEEDLYN
jgi:hypothetical protein